MKYIDADKLRAEIERLKVQYQNWQDEGWDDDMHYGHGRLDSYIHILSFLDTLEEPVSDDLEEAANDHIRKVVDAAGHPGWDWETQDIADAFKAGAEWQKAKMMEGAVEGIVEYNFDKNSKGYYSIRPTYVEECVGEKVKIIVVKEEKQ